MPNEIAGYLRLMLVQSRPLPIQATHKTHPNTRFPCAACLEESLPEIAVVKRDNQKDGKRPKHCRASDNGKRHHSMRQHAFGSTAS